MTMPGTEPTPGEQDVLRAMRAERDRCVCGAIHEDSGEAVTSAMIGRMRAYLAQNPGHRFAVDVDEGVVAAVIVRDPGPPEVIAWASGLAALLDHLGAPPAAGLS